MRNTNKGFTLVELIVVITILAILGTIAFISLGSYTADARNSKRLDGISKIASAVDNGLIGGSSILAFTQDTGNAVTGMSLGGTGAASGDNYFAGTPNATALKINLEQFQDPLANTPYRIGVGKAAGGVFQVAATLEEGSNRKASVVGNFTPRTQTGGTASLVTGSGSKDASLENVSDINYFKTGDIVDSNGGQTGLTVVTISSDGLKITLDGTFTGTGIYLASPESNGLIAAYNSGSLVVTDKSTQNFPYEVK